MNIEPVNSDKRTGWGKLPFAKIIAGIAEFFGTRLLIGLLLATTALIFFGWLASEVFEGETKVFDDSVRQSGMQIAAPALTKLMIFFSLVGSAKFLALLGVVVFIVFLILKWRRGLVLFLFTIAGEIILDLTLKEFFQRPRPQVLYGYSTPASYSFPSGHALGSFCFFGILAWLVAARLQKRWLKIIIWSLSAALILLIGFSRIYLGVHYASDVVGGYAAALVWVFTVALGDFFFSRRNLKSV